MDNNMNNYATNMMYGGMNYGGYPAGNYYTPYMYNPNAQVPKGVPSLTPEEIAMIKQAPVDKFNIAISKEDQLRAICNHRDVNGVDRVVQMNDGTGDAFCPICNERWSTKEFTKEAAKEIVDDMISMMQNSKWVGNFGIELVRDYYPMIPLLKKFPDLYDYAMKNFNKFCNVNGFNTADDASVYSKYNSIMGNGGMTYNPVMNYNGYGMPQQMPNMNMGYAPAPQMAPQYGQMGQMATAQNPMQAMPMNGMPYGGYPQDTNVAAPNPNGAYAPNVQPTGNVVDNSGMVKQDTTIQL